MGTLGDAGMVGWAKVALGRLFSLGMFKLQTADYSVNSSAQMRYAQAMRY
jgi:hypothetical protein